jgi:serine/threonine protein kinase
MLNILNYLHKCKILHTDIKPDNFLIDTLPNGDSFTPHRTNCLVLIDFNRSIYQNAFPKQTEFVIKVGNKSLLCPEMKSGRPWSKQVIHFKIYLSVLLIHNVRAYKFFCLRNLKCIKVIYQIRFSPSENILKLDTHFEFKFKKKFLKDLTWIF